MNVIAHSVAYIKPICYVFTWQVILLLYFNDWNPHESSFFLQLFLNFANLLEIYIILKDI